MSWWVLLAGTVPASLVAGYWAGRRSVARLRTELQCQYGMARAELEERERHAAHAQMAGFRKIDCCPIPAGCMETMKIGLN